MKRKNNCSDFCLFQTGRNFLWKKFSFLLMCAFLGSLPTTAQTRKVGDPIVKDGVPCVIIQVYDEAGNHGLAMSLTPTRKALKAAKKTGDMKWFYSPKKLKGSAKNLHWKYLTEYYNRTKCDSLKIQTSKTSTSIRPSTSHSGKENMKNIIDYCSEKGIEMEMYFPEYAWAQSLGEGWFIPGVNELESLVKLRGFEGIGDKKKPREIWNIAIKSDVNWKNTITTFSQNGTDISLFKDVDISIVSSFASKNYAVVSSTIVKPKKNKRKETKYACPTILVPLSKIGALSDVITTSYYWTYTCAVCEF